MKNGYFGALISQKIKFFEHLSKLDRLTPLDIYSPGTQRKTAKVSNIPTKNLLSQDLISDSTRDIYEQLNNGGKCGDSVDGRGMPVCAYFQLNAKFTSNG